jgi:hypothetical protein
MKKVDISIFFLNSKQTKKTNNSKKILCDFFYFYEIYINFSTTPKDFSTKIYMMSAFIDMSNN